jgi:hypothetical protein
MAWNDVYDARYNAATSDAERQQIVAERDAAAAQMAAANDSWHKSRGTGPYATQGAASSTSSMTDQSANQRASASSYLQDILIQYGLGSLASSVDSLINQWGTNTGVIANQLRNTDAYKTRFAGMLALQAKGVTDVRNESEYIGLESQYRQVFRDAGIQDYIGTAGSQTEQQNIAKLVGDYSVSVNEVKNRVADAQRVVNDTAPEVRDSLQRFYNVSASDLVAFTLDPTKTQTRINQIANAAIIGGYAQARGLSADVGTAENIANLSQGGAVSQQALAGELSTAAGTKRDTQRLANIDQTSLTDSDILNSQFNLDTDAQQKIKQLQSRERARFSGTSSIGASSLASYNGI